MAAPADPSGGTPVPGRPRQPVPWRIILASIGAAAGAYVGWLLVIALRREITWLVVAGFFAVVLSPPVDILVRHAKLRRTLAAFIVFVLGFATIGLLLYAFIRPLVDEITKFVNDLPRLVQDAQAGRGPVGHLVKRYDLVKKANEYAPKLKKYVSSSGSQALTILRTIGNGVVSALTILVLTFLLLVEGPKIMEGAISLFGPERQARLKRIGHSSSRAISGYMAGNILISIIAALITYFGLWAFGVPFRGVAALWMGFADLIPLIGATLGAVPTVGLAFLHSVTAGIGMIVLYIVYQQFENHVLQVTIMARTVKLSPLAVLVSLLVGVQLFGILGALLAIPAAGIIHVVAVDMYRERQLKRAEAAVDTTAGNMAGAPAALPVTETGPGARPDDPAVAGTKGSPNGGPPAPEPGGAEAPEAHPEVAPGEAPTAEDAPQAAPADATAAAPADTTAAAPMNATAAAPADVTAAPADVTAAPADTTAAPPDAAPSPPDPATASPPRI